MVNSGVWHATCFSRRSDSIAEMAQRFPIKSLAPSPLGGAGAAVEAPAEVGLVTLPLRCLLLLLLQLLPGLQD